MTAMFRLGLTGGIGSGKTQVANLLADLGASVIDTDLIAHQLTATGGRAIDPIQKAFGDEVIEVSGALNCAPRGRASCWVVRRVCRASVGRVGSVASANRPAMRRGLRPGNPNRTGASTQRH